ncbi:hypothetical protein ACMYR3_05200 [Ampullimonas aquatilis]|uniref:hypothetical protein n=1 Tax=Ampullimonas aquatilis TaxID=1341549 RepID=UPI003C75142C
MVHSNQLFRKGFVFEAAAGVAFTEHGKALAAAGVVFGLFATGVAAAGAFVERTVARRAVTKLTCTRT